MTRRPSNLCLVYLPPRERNLLKRRGDGRSVPAVRATAATVDELLARMKREGWTAGRWFIEDYRHLAIQPETQP